MISDDGNRLVIEQRTFVIWKILGSIFLVLAILMPLILVLGLLLPPNHASFDCDRARGTCVLKHAAWQKEVAIGDIAAAELKHRGATRNESSADWVEVQLKNNGKELRTSESVYHRPLREAMQAAVMGLNQFLANPDQPRFHAEYQSSDTDVAGFIPMAILAPLILGLMLRLWVVRSVEIDRAARTVVVREKRKFHRANDEIIPFDEVGALSFFGNNWGSLVVTRKNAAMRVVLVVPWAAVTRARVRELRDKLTEILGVPFNVADDVKKRWEL